MAPNSAWGESSEAQVERKIHLRALMAWIGHIIYILYSLEVGIFLLFLPWHGIWENNYLLYLYPKIRPIVANPFFKGAVLGLGIVNVMIGIQEIAHLRKNPGSHFSR